MQVNEVQNADAKRAEIDRQIEQGRVYFRSRAISELGEQGIYEEVVESLSL